MKYRPFALLFFLAAQLFASNVLADDAAIVSAVRAADDERIAATIAADPKRLDAIFSDQLSYTHSSGKVDTKASYTESLVTHRSVYESIDCVRRDIRVIAPGVALVSGRTKIVAKSNGQPVNLDLNFLAVWREEDGRWRFLAWQSCKNPPPEPAAPATPANVKVTS